MNGMRLRGIFDEGNAPAGSGCILAQENVPIRVIIGNPPYSAGAKKAGLSQNEKYEYLDQRIEETYVKGSKAVRKAALYDSYIRSIRWASDRIGKQGVIGFVSNAGFIEGAASSGLRNALEQEFSDIWIFHLRGLRGQKTAGERAKQEGGQIFGMGSSAAIAITVLSRKESHTGKGRIRFCDIGDYLTAQQIYAHAGTDLRQAPETDKFHWLHRFGSIAGIPEKAEDAQKSTNPEGRFRRWQKITPDEYGDWLCKRNSDFADFMPMKTKKEEKGLFSLSSNGLVTARNSWVWNFSEERVKESVDQQVMTYEAERQRLNERLLNKNKEARLAALKDSPEFSTCKLSWTRALQNDVALDKPLSSEDGTTWVGLFRPYTKEVIFFSRRLNEVVYQLPKIFPYMGAENRVICVTPDSKGLSCLITNNLPDFELVHHAQCFPLFHYAKVESQHPDGDMFQQAGGEKTPPRYARKSAITSEGMAYFRKAWPGATFNEDDVFYYIYGLLHSPEYRNLYATSLSKELPRIPCVKTESDFWAFSKSGRELADLHLNYEKAASYFSLDDAGHVHIKKSESIEDKELYRVEKMTFHYPTKSRKKADRDLSRLFYNKHIEITGIPLSAYNYVVNGKPALEWITTKYAVDNDTDSGIPNDPNDWANAVARDPRYPLLLFLKIITVSMKTNEIVSNLPPI